MRFMTIASTESTNGVSSLLIAVLSSCPLECFYTGRDYKSRLKALPAHLPDRPSKLDKPLRSDVRSLDTSQIVQDRDPLPFSTIII